MTADFQVCGGLQRHRAHQHQEVTPMTRHLQACEISDFAVVDLGDMVLWSSSYILVVEPSDDTAVIYDLGPCVHHPKSCRPIAFTIS